jgi:hypothetical protein
MDDSHSTDDASRVSPDDEFLARFIADDVAQNPAHPAWSDERFVKWLEQRAIGERSTELAHSGRSLLVRAYCRRHGIWLAAGPPSIHDGSLSRDGVAPLVDIGCLTLEESVVASGWISIPATHVTRRCIAVGISRSIECFAPFIAVGDIVLIARERLSSELPATVWLVEGAPVIADRDRAAEFIGTVAALWPGRRHEV